MNTDKRRYESNHVLSAFIGGEFVFSCRLRRCVEGPLNPLQCRFVPITCYLDAFSGVSGDMLVGALADAGADQAAITDAIASLDAGAVAQVHQVPIEKVHFHEVGAADSIADIVGAAVSFDLLEIETVVCSPLNVGSGTVRTEHGLLPVPAPATALLLTGVPIYARGPALELTTPTGAAVAVTLATRFGVLPPMKVTATGYGAGDHEFPDHANVLRVILGELTGADEAISVCVIEANIDDLNPQVLAYTTERLVEFGALDVSLQPVQMKKGRAGTLLRAVAKPEHREAIAQLIFAETSTLGVRIYPAERRVQARTFTEVDTPHGKVRIKVSSEGSYAPTYDEDVSGYLTLM